MNIRNFKISDTKIELKCNKKHREKIEKYEKTQQKTNVRICLNYTKKGRFS